MAENPGPAHQSEVHQNEAHQSGVHQSGVHQNEAPQNGVHQNEAHQSGVHQNVAHQSGVHQNGAPQNGVHPNGGHRCGCLEMQWVSDPNRPPLEAALIWRHATRNDHPHETPPKTHEEKAAPSFGRGRHHCGHVLARQLRERYYRHLHHLSATPTLYCLQCLERHGRSPVRDPRGGQKTAWNDHLSQIALSSLILTSRRLMTRQG